MNYKFQNPIEGTIGMEKYQCNIQWQNGTFITDEPVAVGGQDTGPNPHTLLLSALASCTLVTLRSYIDRKGWDIPKISVKVNYFQQIIEGKLSTTIDRKIQLSNTVEVEKIELLNNVAKVCSISKLLESNITIQTFTNNNN